MTAWRLDEVRDLLAEVAASGGYAAGFVAYGASPAFDPALVALPADGEPLASFHFFEKPPRFYKELESAWGAKLEWTPDIDSDCFAAQFAQIKMLIGQGVTYQVNFTFRLNSSSKMDLARLFSQLAADEPPPFASLFRSPKFSIASLSPEMFFEWHGSQVRCRPMKGTAPRQATRELDAIQSEALRSSVKDRAENLMVVDMIRNDLGRIAKVGSVSVPALFEVESYPTVLQMTSTVEAEFGGGLCELFTALFPCASVVGAPKVSTMGEISRLESSPRGVYTGAIGWVAPGSRAKFSVAIRTITDMKDRDSLSYGVGSGIVWDSDFESEWRECLLKGEALRRPSQPWGLLETLRWSKAEGYWLLDHHVARLERSARELGVLLDPGKVLDELMRSADRFEEDTRVRLIVFRDGRVEVSGTELAESPSEIQARLALQPVSSHDPALRHKTNRREFYERCVDHSGVDEALLWNERGEATEFCNGNLVALIDGRMVTPPVECGLLEGTMRAELLRLGEVKEEVVVLEDLSRAEKLFRINSVRGWQRVRLLR